MPYSFIPRMWETEFARHIQAETDVGDQEMERERKEIRKVEIYRERERERDRERWISRNVDLWFFLGLHSLAVFL